VTVGAFGTTKLEEVVSAVAPPTLATTLSALSLFKLQLTSNVLLKYAYRKNLFMNISVVIFKKMRAVRILGIVF